MVYTKDGLTKEKLVELLQYSLRPECQFLTAVKPNTDVVNDHVFQNESVVRMLKMEEKINEEIQADLTVTYTYKFSVKVLVEDKYWIKVDKRYYKSKRVPAKISNDVAQILNS